VWIFDADTGSLLRTLSDTGTVDSAAWSPDGKYLATCSRSDQVHVWGMSSGSSNLVLADENHRLVTSVAWSPDSRHLATGAEWDEAVRVWAGVSGAQVRALTAPCNDVRSVTWSPDGLQVAAVAENMALIWDAGTGELLQTLLGNSGASAAAWSPDSERLAVGYGNNTIRTWHAATGTLITMSVPLTDGWAVLYDGNRYAFDGTPRGEFWWSVGLARFEVGELEPYIPELRRVPAEACRVP
jgi:WD40 repeat protein